LGANYDDLIKLKYMKISNDNPTNHIFVGLMDYRVDYEENPNSNYGFGYFELDTHLIGQLNQFHDDWDMGHRPDAELINISTMFLINSQFIHNDNDENKHNYKGVKLDSINFLEGKPALDHPIMVEGSGYIIASCDGFYIECEDLKRRGYSYTIYRSIKNISYWKINHLLKRVKPV